MLAGIAEFERELIKARTGEGRTRAKARGVKRSWPVGFERTNVRALSVHRSLSEHRNCGSELYDARIRLDLDELVSSCIRRCGCDRNQWVP